MNNAQIKTFLAAGRAVFTLSSPKSGAHYTYRIENKGNAAPLFVGLLTAPETFTYLGVISSDPMRFRLTRASRQTSQSAPVLALDWFLGRLATDRIPEGVFRHAGRCGRCGRELTDPESIDRGIGPHCAGV